jgi:MFS family permease
MLNAVSFAAVVFSLMSMDLGKLRPSVPTPRSKGQLRDGFRYVARTPELGIPLLMMGLVGMLAYEFQVTLPYAAKHVFHGDSQTFGLMTSAMGIGAIAGGLIAAAVGRTGMRPMVLSALAFGVVLCLAAVAPNLPLELIALGAVGFASVTFLAMGNSTLQLATDPQMRGRVMALWSVAFLGSTPIGGPLIGWITAISGARVGLGVGALSCFGAAGLGLLAVRRLAPGSPAVQNAPLQTSSHTI